MGKQEIVLKRQRGGEKQLPAKDGTMRGRPKSEIGQAPRDRKNLAVFELIKKLKNEEVEPGALDKYERKKIIQYFLENQLEATNYQIAQLLGISPQAVGRQKKNLIKSAAWQIGDLDVLQVATDLKIKAEQLQRRLTGNGDYMDAWKIQVDLIKTLQSMGFIIKVPRQIQIQAQVIEQINHTIQEGGGDGLAEVLERLGAGSGNGGKNKALPEHRPAGD
jgi:hypothetical protein